MNIELAKEYFNEIKNKNTCCDEYRLEQAYIDILVLIELYEDVANKVNGLNLFEFLHEGLIDEAMEIKHYNRQLITLLRSLYHVASSFINILLFDCGYRNKDGEQTTLPQLYNKPQNTSHCNNREQLKKLFSYADKAYLLQVYRNMYIAHSNSPRHFGIVASSKEAQEHKKIFRLNPSRLDGGDNSCYEDAINLLGKYDLGIPNRPEGMISINELTDLFYKVPLIKDNEINKDDRDKIYDIMRCYTIQSMTYIEILDSIDKLIEGICKDVTS